jgi:hypothetical protein
MSVALTLQGSLLAASETDRTLRYLLCPYGEQGRTSLGLVTIDAGTLELPADPSALVFNLEHERRQPVGRAVSLVDSAAGLEAVFSIAPTTAGNDLLAEAALGLRAGASVELENVTIRDGRLLTGRLVGAGAVVAPAFPSALLVASDTELPPAAAVPTTEEPAMTATLPAPVPAVLSAATPSGAHSSGRTLSAVAAQYAAYNSGALSRSELEAALTDLTYSGNDAAMPPQWLGELWDGIDYDRDIVNELSQAPLTSGSLGGWKWNPVPVGGNYSGNKDPIISSPIGIDPVSQGIARWAGGHDFDRIFIDLGDASVMESYFRTMSNDYAEWSNAQATFDLLTAAGAPLENADPLALLVSVATSIKGGPTFIAMSSDFAAALMQTDASLPFLTGNLLLSGRGAVGGSGMFIGQELPAATILAGRREAATFFEPAGVPIKVRAVDLANGGEDGAAFGYCATLVRKPTSFKAGTTIVTP